VLFELCSRGKWCEAVEFGESGAPVLARGIVVSFGVAALLLAVRAVGALENARFVADDLFLGIYHIGVGGAALTWLAAAPHGAAQLAWLFSVTAINDTAAYFCGSRIGGRKLSPVLSPNKTVSGGICGLAGGVVAGILAGYVLRLSPGFLTLVILSFCVALAGQAGDLMKSYVKRLYGVKDSGRLIPGHGGLYDRLDAALFAAPVALLWL
jgi:phosphatidate cytidylyltransferase